MELNPILEADNTPNPNLWYVVSALGDRPSLRVGHTAVAKSGVDKETQQVVFIGGANPSETFSDIHILDATTLSWNMIPSTGFSSRYEHASFIPPSQPDKVYVLAGANQEANISEHTFLQCYDLQAEKWSTVKAAGVAPCARTHHTTVAIGDCIYIFSGGKGGAEPIQDRQVYSFNTSTNSWLSLSITGDGPTPRHGHTMSAVGSKIYCFGGMAGTKFYNDIHILDVEKSVWTTPKVKKRNLPEPRAAHAAVTLGNNLYIFGGMSKEGVALSDLWRLDVTTMQWDECAYEGPPPASRLDMASCVISWTSSPEPADPVDEVTESMEKSSLEAPQGACSDLTCKLLLIHGGMDTQGEIFDDCLVYRIE